MTNPLPNAEGSRRFSPTKMRKRGIAGRMHDRISDHRSTNSTTLSRKISRKTKKKSSARSKTLKWHDREIEVSRQSSILRA
jgi:hypothetical protein